MAHRTCRYYDGEVAYGFGFGLSYTQFASSVPELSTPIDSATKDCLGAPFISASFAEMGGIVIALDLNSHPSDLKSLLRDEKYAAS
jgi:hypothetical protein